MNSILSKKDVFLIHWLIAKFANCQIFLTTLLKCTSNTKTAKSALYPCFMKKLFLLFIFSLFSFLNSYAQEGKVSFGIRGGFGYANINNPGRYSGKYSYKQHIQLGVLSEIHIVKPLFLQVELLFSNPGTRLYQISNGYKAKDSTFNFNCLQLPVQVKLKIGGEQVKGYFMTGIAPSWLINASIKYKVDSTASFIDYTIYETRFTANLINTIGAEIDIGELVIPFIDFRYVQGLTHLHRMQTGTKPSTNLQFLLSIGVKF